MSSAESDGVVEHLETLGFRCTFNSTFVKFFDHTKSGRVVKLLVARLRVKSQTTLLVPTIPSCGIAASLQLKFCYSSAGCKFVWDIPRLFIPHRRRSDIGLPMSVRSSVLPSVRPEP